MPELRLTSVQRAVVRALHDGQVLTLDRDGLRLEPSNTPVNRHTLWALIRAGVVEDPSAPLFNRHAGLLTALGRSLPL